MVTVWYLLVAFGQSGGIAMVPQQSQQACTQTASWINAHRYDSEGLSYAACVPGVK